MWLDSRNPGLRLGAHHFLFENIVQLRNFLSQTNSDCEAAQANFLFLRSLTSFRINHKWVGIVAYSEITLTLADEAQKGKRSILLNGVHSHDADETKLQQIREQAQAGEWRIRPDIGQAIGRDLYNLLDGSGQVIGKARREARIAGNDLAINIQTPVSLDNLPFELLHVKSFLVLNGDFHLLRRVNDRNRLKAAEPPNRSLKMLFMACSPLDLPVQSVLQFEKEDYLDKWPSLPLS